MNRTFGHQRDISEADYHDLTAVGSSAIKLLAKSPAHYASSLESPKKGSAALDLGSIVHMKFLEPKRFSEECHILQHDVSFATKEGIALKKSMPDVKHWLKPHDSRVLSQIENSYFNIIKSLGADVLMCSKNEQAYLWDEDGFHGKALIDAVSERYRLLVDIKTCSDDFSERSLGFHALKYGYPLQAAWYKRGMSKIRPETESWPFVFFMFQTVPPYTARVMTIDDDTMRCANIVVEKAIENYRKFQQARATGDAQFDPNTTHMILTAPQYWIDENE